MRLKEPFVTPQNGGYQFFYKHHGVIVPVRDSSLKKVIEKAKQSMTNNGLAIPEDFSTIVEHQICLRQDDPTASCYSGGIGDDLHNIWIGPFLKRTEQLLNKAGLSKLAKVAGDTASCGGCGGTTVYEDGKNNLGRAGDVNNFFS